MMLVCIATEGRQTLLGVQSNKMHHGLNWEQNDISIII